MKKARLNGTVIILTKEALILTKEEVILILEVDFMVIVSDVVKRDRSFECKSFESGKNNRNILTQEDIENIPSGPNAGENIMVRRTLCNKGSDEETILRRSLFKTRCKMPRKCCKVIIDS